LLHITCPISKEFINERSILGVDDTVEARLNAAR
jgi:hypothetical protein